jgi:hypothetical protein
MPRQLISLAWKEWCEARAFLWIGLGVFIGLPAIAGLEWSIQFSRHFRIWTSPWVLCFGGLLAVFVAVGISCRDLNGRLEDFWRSRPVGVVRWMFVKYFVGLCVVLLACGIPLVVQILVNGDRDPDGSFFFLVLLPTFYSVAFLAGCLVRRASHAAMLSLAALLLIFLLPLILPMFSWLDISRGISDVSLIIYVSGMLGIALLGMILSLIVVRWSWHVESGRKLLYGAFGLAVLLLCGSAAYQVGTNMPVLQAISFEPDEGVVFMRNQGNRGCIVTEQFNEETAERRGYEYAETWRYRTFEVTPAGITLSAPQPEYRKDFWNRTQAMAPGHPKIEYRAWENFNPDDNNTDVGAFTCTLMTDPLDRLTGDERTLWTIRGQNPWKEGPNGNYYDWGALNPTTYVWKNRLYVIGRRLVTLDISDPLRPKEISNEPFSNSFGFDEALFRWRSYGDLVSFDDEQAAFKKLTLNLPPIPDLAAAQRLEARIAMEYGMSSFDGQFLVRSAQNRLDEYRLTKLTDKGAEFEPVGFYRPSILEAAFGMSGYVDLQIANGLLFTSTRGSWIPPTQRVAGLNPNFGVFALTGPGAPRLVGHFAAPGADQIRALPDGRSIVGGDKLWLLGPPPGFEAK